MSLSAELDPASHAENLRESSRALSSRWPVAIGLALSLLLHLLFALLVVEFQPRDLAPAADTFVPIELVTIPPPPPQAQTPAPVPAPPPEPRTEPSLPAPPPQIVQRETAPSAVQSSTPRAVAPRSAAPTAPQTQRPPESRDGLLPPVPPSSPVERRPATAGVAAGRSSVTEQAGPIGEKLAQSEVDFLLAQVLRIWLIDFRSPRFKDIVISGNFQLNPDGTLGAPFGVNDPWDLERMIANYKDLLRPDMRDQRAALESFLGAMRQAQPFKRQPDAPPMTGPKILSFSFRLGDL